METQESNFQTESLLQSACERLLSISGIKYLHLRNKKGAGKNISHERGWPDLMIYPGDGEVQFIELKRDSKQELRPEQLKFKTWADSHGYSYCLVHDLEVFKKIIRGER